MKKRVKGGIQKTYCDRCKKLLYDEIPKPPSVKFCGMWIPEFKMKNHADYEVLAASKKRGIEAGVYCKECAEILKGV